MDSSKTDTISAACEALASNDIPGAESIIKEEYPFTKPYKTVRKCTPQQATKIFVRDGFIDRYSGAKVVFPPVLRLISNKMSDVFPHHPNWKMGSCHIAYWDLTATIDHQIPVSLGGVDDESNWITTSMARNSGKANYSLKELGWELLPGGSISEWDGLLGWYISYIETHPEIVLTNSMKAWLRAAKRVSA